MVDLQEQHLLQTAVKVLHLIPRQLQETINCNRFKNNRRSLNLLKYSTKRDNQGLIRKTCSISERAQSKMRE